MKIDTSIKYLIIAAAVASIGFSPLRASAATVYLEASRNTVSVGDTLVLSVKVNAEAVTINTIDGDIAIKAGGNNIVVQQFSLANSAFGLWPRTPSLSSDGLDISFVGGVPGGFNIEGATIFKMVIEAKKEGSVTIAPKNIIAYANDGNGTKLSVTMKEVTINIGPKKAGSASVDDWGGIVSSDVMPPEDFIVVLGQDPSLFDGKKFAFFSALDNQSGISYYDVSEDGKPAVRSGSMYVLQDQSDSVKLTVTAYDKAGNKKSAIYPLQGAKSKAIPWLMIIVVILAIGAVWFLVKKVKKSKKDVPLPQ